MRTISTILIAVLLLFTLSQVGQPVQAVQEYQLNLSHIECLGTYVEIHFVLLNTVEGDSISDLTYTYGTIPPGPRNGNVVHFTDNVAPGYYNITSASVWVNSTLVTLHNPGDYAGEYGCQQQPTPTSTATFTPTFTPTNTPTNTPTFTPTNTPTNTPTFTPTATTVTPTDPPKQTPTVTETPTETPTLTPTSTPTNTPTFTPTATTVTPTDPPKQTPTVTEPPTETPTNTPEPSPTATPADPTATPATPTVTATFSVPNTGRDDNFAGPAFMIAGLSTIGFGLALSKLLQKASAIKRK